MSDHREVRKVALDARVQNLLGPGVAKWTSVLVQQVHQFLGDDSVKKEKAHEMTYCKSCKSSSHDMIPFGKFYSFNSIFLTHISS